MDHRRFLAHPEAHRPFPGGDLFARIGGRAAIDTLVDGLYDGIEVDPALRPLFGRDLATERESQKRFFTDWLGGEGNYRPYLPLKHRHDLLPITRALAGRWLVHFGGSLEVAVSDVDARRAIYRQARLLARALVNEEEVVREPSLAQAVDPAVDGQRRGLFARIVASPGGVEHDRTVRSKRRPSSRKHRVRAYPRRWQATRGFGDGGRTARFPGRTSKSAPW
jgi:hemoglobin